MTKEAEGVTEINAMLRAIGASEVEGDDALDDNPEGEPNSEPEEGEGEGEGEGKGEGEGVEGEDTKDSSKPAEGDDEFITMSRAQYNKLLADLQAGNMVAPQGNQPAPASAPEQAPASGDLAIDLSNMPDLIPDDETFGKIFEDRKALNKVLKGVVNHAVTSYMRQTMQTTEAAIARNVALSLHYERFFERNPDLAVIRPHFANEVAKAYAKNPSSDWDGLLDSVAKDVRAKLASYGKFEKRRAAKPATLPPPGAGPRPKPSSANPMAKEIAAMMSALRK